MLVGEGSERDQHTEDEDDRTGSLTHDQAPIRLRPTAAGRRHERGCDEPGDDQDLELGAHRGRKHDRPDGKHRRTGASERSAPGRAATGRASTRSRQAAPG